MAAKLKVTQVKSTISHIARNRARSGPSACTGSAARASSTDNPATRGMVRAGALPRHGRGDRGRREPRHLGEGQGMKLHDLQPAPGSRKPRTRVGRGIAAGKGKTAGRGTKGQKARAGGGIPPWFEGGQTPLHMRIPKLRGFKNRFKIEYEVVNIGAIGALADRGAFEFEDTKKSTKSAPITVNQDILRAVGLVRTLNKPLKILGAGELTVPLFVVADAFTASARAKIEAAGGSVNVLEVPTSPLAALGVTPRPRPRSRPSARSPPRPRRWPTPPSRRAGRRGRVPVADVDETADEAPAAGKRAKPAAKTATRRPRRRRPRPRRLPRSQPRRRQGLGCDRGLGRRRAGPGRRSRPDRRRRVRRRPDPGRRHRTTLRRRRLTRVRLPSQRLSRARYPASDPLCPRAADRLPAAGRGARSRASTRSS